MDRILEPTLTLVSEGFFLCSLFNYLCTMQHPFTETKHEDYYTREFSQNTNEEEFIWHRDHEDRIVESLHPTDWKLQLDEELPTNIERPIFIREGLFHRLIKGSGNLRIKLIKIKLSKA